MESNSYKMSSGDLEQDFKSFNDPAGVIRDILTSNFLLESEMCLAGNKNLMKKCPLASLVSGVL